MSVHKKLEALAEDWESRADRADRAWARIQASQEGVSGTYRKAATELRRMANILATPAPWAPVGSLLPIRVLDGSNSSQTLAYAYAHQDGTMSVGNRPLVGSAGEDPPDGVVAWCALRDGDAIPPHPYGDEGANQ